MDLDAAASIRDHDELRRTVPVLVVTILAFFAHQALHIEPATVALTGAAVALMVTKIGLEQALAKIEWPTLFFFVALFVMVGALEETGAIGEVATAVEDLTGGDRTAELMGTLWIGAIGSAIVDNIPFTTAMIPVVEQLQGAIDATTPTGGRCRWEPASAATRRSSPPARTWPPSGLAQRAGQPIGFVQFLKVGVPVTVVSILMASAYVLVRYVALN